MNGWKAWAGAAALCWAVAGAAGAAETRGTPLDLRIIVDGSMPAGLNRDAALAWIRDEVIGGTLEPGDRLTVWSAGTEARRIFHRGEIDADAGGELGAAALEGVDVGADGADFAGAVREAAAWEGGDAGGGGDAAGLTVIMVICGSPRALAPSLAGDGAALFRWSRVEDYPSWQVLVVDPGIGERARRAAAAYMGARRDEADGTGTR